MNYEVTEQDSMDGFGAAEKQQYAKIPEPTSDSGIFFKRKMAASYSPALHCSTIGAGGLNFSVRNGKRWDPAAITT